ncbi:DUF6518 family protein [Curtobacterium sp. B18]|uniref:DUF6518 family protein n=1 Tax=Curtobacterium sp. B18 TaxID=95614 RepID=UPI000347A033|nr:DUF6518 family protein [Curtobacterium sp. B18]
METTMHAGTTVCTADAREHRVPAAARVSMALTGALLAGVLTSFGQAVPGLSSVANSAGPWFVVATALCLLAGVRAGRVALPLAMLFGIVLLELMHVGYWATTNLRGYPDVLSITNFWVLMGIPAGVLAGAVAVAVRTRDVRWRGPALGATAAVLVGEGVRALLQVAATTGSTTWVVEIVVGVAVLVVAVLAARTPTGRILALATGVLGTVGVLGIYLLLGG